MAPQLPIEGLIAEHGGFPDIPAKKVESLRYWKLGEKEIVCNEEQSSSGLEKTMQYLQTWISSYDCVTTPYLTKPIPHNAPSYTDYDHLSRFLEWSVKEDFDEN